MKFNILPLAVITPYYSFCTLALHIPEDKRKNRMKKKLQCPSFRGKRSMPTKNILENANRFKNALCYNTVFIHLHLK